MPQYSLAMWLSETVTVTGTTALKSAIPVGWPLPESGSMPLPEILLPRITFPETFWPGAWAWMATPASPLSRSVLSMTRLSYEAVPGMEANMPTPAPPLPSDTLWLTRLSYTPPRLGSAALPLCEGRVIPQSSLLFRAMLYEITLWALGPNSSVIRMPPTLFSTTLCRMLDQVTLAKWSPSPQSPGMGPWGVHSNVSVVPKPASLSLTVLCAMRTFEVPATRMPSPVACSTVKPSTTEPLAPGPETRSP